MSDEPKHQISELATAARLVGSLQEGTPEHEAATARLAAARAADTSASDTYVDGLIEEGLNEATRNYAARG